MKMKSRAPKNRDHEKLAAYVERFFARAERTAFPTVRTAARALRWTQSRVVQAVEDDPTSAMFLTAYYTHPEQPIAEHFVERLE